MHDDRGRRFIGRDSTIRRNSVTEEPTALAQRSYPLVRLLLIALLIVGHGCQLIAHKAPTTTASAGPRILFIGSSSIFFWKSLNADFADVPGTILRDGVGSRTLEDITAHVSDEIIAKQPDKVLVYAGSIDMHDHGRTPQQTFDQFVSLCDAVHTALPDTTVYFISCKPSIAKWEGIELENSLNEMVKEMAIREKGVVYIDTYTPMLDSNGQPLERYFNSKDHNHLNRAGYDLWTKIIRPYLVDSSVG